MDEEKTLYITIFRNDSDEYQHVIEARHELAEIAPHDIFTLKSEVPTTTYARFKEVLWKKDNSMAVIENPVWQYPPTPQNHFRIDILNESGRELEAVQTEAGYIQCPRGIPLFFFVSPSFFWVWYSEIRIVTNRVKKESTAIRGYLEFIDTTQFEKKLRPKAELQVIVDLAKKLKLPTALNVPDEVTKVIK